ncbi:hypothetical protein NX02_03110 [Sphingomonas sanxanigenens DSM 19645 = NX02]|uniref:Uncharacterized protein n=2 Tax=Sphingomonas sanxanigenens TaxID=397260 RepID=W0A7C0_9SPHN|nr:hypothetical protein NX02_03110 [Sphingomonas sanxanigenens DSM 19645 = NX02]
MFVALAVRLGQRYALFIAIFSGLIVVKLVLPDDASDWLSLSVSLPVTLIVFQLLYKYGATSNRPGRHK